MDKAIGGYFELELFHGEHFHSTALRLNSARSCLEYILRVRQYTKVYVPYFTCSIVKQPFDLLGVACEFYSIDENLEPTALPQLGNGEAFLYTNYFGLKQECVKRLAKHYGTQLIVDNAQAFFAEPIEGINTFYSPRKFVGVPDGGYLYISKKLEESLPQATSHNRMSHLLKRFELGAEVGYEDFKQNDEALGQQPIMRMSKLTEALLGAMDYEKIKEIRRQNFDCLHKVLGSSNRLHLPCKGDAVPMVYPYWSESTDLKRKLIENRIFVATYWPNVLEWCQPTALEYQIADQCCFLPIDQRYGKKDMLKIIKLIMNR